MDFKAIAQNFAKLQEREKERNDPGFWVKNRLKEHAWSKQQEVLESVRDHKRTLVASCHASGKSHIASRVVGWWIDVHPKNPTETRVITTAPSWNQVANIMWAYIAEVQEKLHLEGNITAKAAWTFPGFKAPTAFGRKPSDYDESTFQGIHSTYVLAVIDEAGGVSENIFTSVETITTNEHARILAIANPDDPNSYMAKIWRQQEKLEPSERSWNLIRISAFDTPNFTGEWVPERARSNLLQKSWVEEAIERWGKEDPRYKSKILAIFPDIGTDGLFNLGKVLESMNNYSEFDYDPNSKHTIGVDVGMSQTGDFSVIVDCQGGKVRILEKVKGYDGNKLSRAIGQWVDTIGAENIDSVRVDAIGVGRGVQVVLRNYVPQHIPIYWVIGNHASPDNIKWYNFRAAMYDTVRGMIDRGELAIPPDEFDGEKTDGLYDEFRSIKYEYRGSRLLIKSKEWMKQKKLGSPDMVDAICYAAMPASLLTGEEEKIIDTDMIMEETDLEYFAVDQWGNEEWCFAPA